MPSRSISSDEPMIDPEDEFLPQCKRFAAIFVRDQRLHGRLLPPAILGRSRCCHRRRNGMVFQHRFVLPKSTAFSSFGRSVGTREMFEGTRAKRTIMLRGQSTLRTHRIAHTTHRLIVCAITVEMSYKVRPHYVLGKGLGLQQAWHYTPNNGATAGCLGSWEHYANSARNW